METLRSAVMPLMELSEGSPQKRPRNSAVPTVMTFFPLPSVGSAAPSVARRYASLILLHNFGVNEIIAGSGGTYS
jgi:hypothetical protein